MAQQLADEADPLELRVGLRRRAELSTPCGVVAPVQRAVDHRPSRSRAAGNGAVGIGRALELVEGPLPALIEPAQGVRLQTL